MDKVLENAISIAKEMGKVLKDNFGSADAVQKIKIGNSGDTTLKADKLAEDKCLELIKQLSPEIGGCSVFSEEIGVVEFPHEGKCEYKWTIDPLDGSRNYSRNIPFFAVSIYVAKNNDTKDPVAGVVYQPMTGECYYSDAERSFLNGKEIKVVKRNISEGVFVIDITFKHREINIENFLKTFSKIAEDPYAFRRIGACALEISFCANGMLDGFLDLWNNSRFLDIAAGLLILKKAGGKVTDLNGKEIRDDNYNGIIACANPDSHAKLMELLKD